jgi:hypothetical protein
MSFPITRTFVAAAALAVAVGSGALAAAPAGAATTQCGSQCTSFYPLSTGTSDVMAVEHASGTNATTGQAVSIAAASSTNQAEDWYLNDEGTVSDFYAAGLISAGMNLHWGNDQVYELDYYPDGVYTGECAGTTASNGSGAVTLQPCGVSASTLWAADTADANGRALPLINGKDNNFSNPYSLTASSVSAQLSSSQLLGVTSSQEWGTIFGVL